MRWTLPFLMLAVLALPALAADEVLMLTGDSIEGEIQAVNKDGITVLAQGKTVVIAPSDLDPHYFYTQWSKRIDKDAESHLRLAVYAFENGMFNQARSQYHKAERLDKDLVKKFETEIVPQIKEGIADHLLDLARRAVKREDWKQAKSVASKILTEMEDTKAAEEARQVLASVHLWQLNADQERFVTSMVRYLPKEEADAIKTQERVVKKIAPIETKIRKAQDLVTKGLRTKSTNRSKDVFKTAAKRFEKAIKDLDKLAATAAGDDALLAYIDEVRAVAVRDAINAYIHAGSVYLIRRAYDDALGMANDALALDPESPEANGFYQRVLRGSQMRSGWYGR